MADPRFPSEVVKLFELSLRDFSNTQSSQRFKFTANDNLYVFVRSSEQIRQDKAKIQ